MSNTNLRITATVSTSADSLAKTLRSIAARVDASALVPGADIEVNGVRIQVADKQVSDIRAWALANGYEVGTRGRYSKTLTDAYAAHLKAERKRIREERAARRAEREAAAETVTA